MAIDSIAKRQRVIVWQSRVALVRHLLLDQFPFLVGAAVGAPLIHLRAGRSAGAGVFKHQAAVAIDEGVAAIAVMLWQPFIILSRTEIILDDSRALGGGGALDH